MTGGSTFTVSLPKDWAERSGIRKGSRILMSEKEDGSIIIYPLDRKPSDQRQKVISLDDDLSLLSRKVIASYIMGFDTIIIKSGGFGSEQRTHIFKLVEGLMGLEVIREDSQSIEIRQMLDPTQLTIPSALSRLNLLAESMIRDLPTALSAANRTLLSDIIIRESHVDKIHWFLLRQINYGIIDHRFSDNVDLDIHLATCYLSVARNIERICDHVENVAQLMLELPKTSSFSSSLVEMSTLCADLFSRSMRSFLKSDIDMARKVLLEVDRHMEDYAISAFTDISKGRKRSQVLSFMLAAESLHRIISYSQDIAEITVDSVLSH
jgi:phosphate uptake regulator